jgi:ribonuclease P protein component
MYAMKNTFDKAERLCRQSLLDQLFAGAAHFTHYPYKILWIKQPVGTFPFPAQVAVTVPKRNFKKAHDRNHIKRRIKEAYRLHKHILYDKLQKADQQLAFIVIYLPREEKEYRELESKLIQALERFPWK